MKLIISAVAVILQSILGQFEPNLYQPITQTTPESQAYQTILWQTKEYRYASYSVFSTDNLMLIANHKQQENSKILADQYHCKFLINGGFYDMDSQPIGWFKTKDSETVNVKNRLFDGYLSLTSTEATIATAPVNQAEYGTQTGPLLILDQQPLPLKIKNDQPRRRMVAAQTAKELTFFVIMDTDSELSGPLLGDLPQFVAELANQRQQEFSAAINLDGGTASSFLTPDLHVTEKNPIGSFFCDISS